MEQSCGGIKDLRKYNVESIPTMKQAVQVDSQDYDELCEIVSWCNGRAVDEDNHLIAIDTLEGTMFADNQDWIIKGLNGEFYPCKPDIFAKSYRFTDGASS